MKIQTEIKTLRFFVNFQATLMELMGCHYQDGKQHDPTVSLMILRLFEDVPAFVSVVAHVSAYPVKKYV